MPAEPTPTDWTSRITLVTRLFPPQKRGGPPVPWYATQWATFAAMYVALPVGLFLMWRYRPWPFWLKLANSVLGPLGALLWTWVSFRILKGGIPVIPWV